MPTETLDPIVEQDVDTTDSLPADEQMANPEKSGEKISVIQMLEDRAKNGYRTGENENDPYRIGLAFEAGGYAGVVSLAMADKLNYYFKAKYGVELKQLVNGFIGNSVGGPNATFAATGQERDGLRVFFRRMPGRFVRKGASYPIAHLDVLEDAIYEDFPLDTDALEASPAPVIIGATKMNGVEPVVIRSDQPMPMQLESTKNVKAKGYKDYQFMKWLIAGCHLPLIAGAATMDKDGNKYTDATIAWQSPIDLAADQGFTHVIDLSNFLPGKPEDELTRNEKIKRNVAEAIAGTIINVYLRREPNYNSSSEGVNYRRLLKEKRGLPFKEEYFTYKGVEVEKIYPADIKGLPDLLDKDVKKLSAGVRAARLAIREKLKLMGGSSKSEQPQPEQRVAKVLAR